MVPAGQTDTLSFQADFSDGNGQELSIPGKGKLGASRHNEMSPSRLLSRAFEALPAAISPLLSDLVWTVRPFSFRRSSQPDRPFKATSEI